RDAMRRVLLLGCVGLILAGCQVAPVAEKDGPRDLPNSSAPVPYVELIKRCRKQIEAANEAFYDNHWVVLDEAARGLEQTARFLVHAADIRAGQKKDLGALSERLAQEASKLREIALSRDAGKINSAMQKLQLTVRELNLSR